MFTPAKKTLLKPLGSNVENGFGVISLHANEIIMSALSGYQKQAFISSRDVVLPLLCRFVPRALRRMHTVPKQMNESEN